MRYIMRRSCLFLVMIAVIVFTGCGQKKKEDPVSKVKNIRQYMLRFLIKLPFRIIAASVWLVLAAVNIVLVKSQ